MALQGVGMNFGHSLAAVVATLCPLNHTVFDQSSLLMWIVLVYLPFMHFVQRLHFMQIPHDFFFGWWFQQVQRSLMLELLCLSVMCYRHVLVALAE